MDEKDFLRIGQLVAEIVDSRLERIDARFEQIDARFEQIDARFEQIDDRFHSFKSEIVAEFNHSLKLYSEQLHREISMVSEGFTFLSEKTDRIEQHIDDLERTLAHRLDVIAIDLAVHRVDPISHRKGYRIREDGPEYRADVSALDGNAQKLIERRKELENEIDEYYALRGIERVTKTEEQIFKEITEIAASYNAELKRDRDAAAERQREKDG